MSYTFTQTGAQIQDIFDRLSQYPTLKDTITVTSLPVTISKTGMTAYHEVVEAVIGTPSVQTSDWTVTTASGSYTISGGINGQTTVILKFAYIA